MSDPNATPQQSTTAQFNQAAAPQQKPEQSVQGRESMGAAQAQARQQEDAARAQAQQQQAQARAQAEKTQQEQAQRQQEAQQKQQQEKRRQEQAAIAKANTRKRIEQAEADLNKKKLAKQQQEKAQADQKKQQQQKQDDQKKQEEKKAEEKQQLGIRDEIKESDLTYAKEHHYQTQIDELAQARDAKHQLDSMQSNSNASLDAPLEGLEAYLRSKEKLEHQDLEQYREYLQKKYGVKADHIEVIKRGPSSQHSRQRKH